MLSPTLPESQTLIRMTVSKPNLNLTAKKDDFLERCVLKLRGTGRACEQPTVDNVFYQRLGSFQRPLPGRKQSFRLAGSMTDMQRLLSIDSPNSAT